MLSRGGRYEADPHAHHGSHCVASGRAKSRSAEAPAAPEAAKSAAPAACDVKNSLLPPCHSSPSGLQADPEFGAGKPRLAELAFGSITVVVGGLVRQRLPLSITDASTAVAAGAREFHLGIKKRAPVIMKGTRRDSQSHVTDVDPGCPACSIPIVELKNVFGAHFDGGEAFFNPGAIAIAASIGQDQGGHSIQGESITARCRGPTRAVRGRSHRHHMVSA